MGANSDGNLHVYMLNVGQADTSIIVSPKGGIIIIDAKNPSKIKNLLSQLGCNGSIEHLIITHPHLDHYSGANSLAKKYHIEEATFAPFWHEFGMGSATYRKLIAHLDNEDTNINFLSGYNRWYPDEIMTNPVQGADPEADPDTLFFELLGPTNGLIDQLEAAKVFNPNHLSIMTRVTWKNFRMIIAGDAQMENWGPFDDERLLEENCYLLRTAHHGSSNGTQWERLERLSPTVVVVSSDPFHGHKIPDLGSAAVFTKFDDKAGQWAVITKDSGTIHLIKSLVGKPKLTCFKEDYDHNVNIAGGIMIDEIKNPTKWVDLLEVRLEPFRTI